MCTFINIFLSLILLTLWKWYVFLFSLVLHSALVVSSWKKRCNPRKEIYERRSNVRESIRNASYLHPKVLAVKFAYSSSCQLPSSPPFPSLSGPPGSHSGLVFWWPVNQHYSQKSSDIVKQLYSNTHTHTHTHTHASLVAQTVKNPLAVQETWVRSLGQGDPLEKKMATHSSILAWSIAWTEEPAGL